MHLGGSVVNEQFRSARTRQRPPNNNMDRGHRRTDDLYDGVNHMNASLDPNREW